MAECDYHFALPHLNPIHLNQRAMARTAVTRSVSGETEPEAHNARNRADETKELDEWWGTVLEIATQIEPLELRRKFLGVVKDGREAKRQVCVFNLVNFTARITESMQCAELLNDKKECEVKVSVGNDLSSCRLTPIPRTVLSISRRVHERTAADEAGGEGVRVLRSSENARHPVRLSFTY